MKMSEYASRAIAKAVFLPSCPAWAKGEIITLVTDSAPADMPLYIFPDEGVEVIDSVLGLGCHSAMLGVWPRLDRLHDCKPFSISELRQGVRRALELPDELTHQKRKQAAARVDRLAADLCKLLDQRSYFADWQANVGANLDLELLKHLRRHVRSISDKSMAEAEYLGGSRLLEALLRRLQRDVGLWRDLPPMLAKPKLPAARRALFFRRMLEWNLHHFGKPVWKAVIGLASQHFDCSNIGANDAARIARGRKNENQVSARLASCPPVSQN